MRGRGGVLTLKGMGAAIIRAVAQGDEGALRFGTRVQLCWSTGIAIVAALFSLYYFEQGNTLLGKAFLVTGALQPLIIGFGLYRLYLQARERFRESIVTESLQRLAPFVLLLVAIFNTSDPLTLICVYFVSSAVTQWIAYRHVVRKHRLPVTRNTELTRYSKHLSVMESLAEIANVLDKALVGFFLGVVPLAAYTLAQLPIAQMLSVFGFIRQLAFPKLVRRDLAELAQSLPQKIRLYSLVTIVTVGVYVLVAPLLFHLLFPAYPEAVLYSQLLALAVLGVPRTLVTQVFIAQKMQRELYVVSVSVPIIRIALLGFLIWQFGIWGAIAAVLASELFAIVLQFALFRKAFRRPLVMP